MVFENLCIFALWTKVALALEGLITLPFDANVKSAGKAIVRVSLYD